MKIDIRKVIFIDGNPNNKKILVKEVENDFIPRVGDIISDFESIDDILSDRGKVETVSVDYMGEKIQVYLGEDNLTEEEFNKIEINTTLYGFNIN